MPNNPPNSVGPETLFLTDHAVTVRPWHPDDAPALFEAIRESIDYLNRWLPWAKDYQSVADAERWIAAGDRELQAGTSLRCGIFDAKTQTCLGGVGLNRIERRDRVASLGYWRRKGAAERGVATRAARLLARHALTQGGFHRIDILVAVTNGPSQSVARKLGAKFEGTLRDRLWVRTQCHDAQLYSLLKSDPISNGL